MNEGQQLVQWAQFYKDYIVPMTPVIAALMATVLLLLDPHVKALVMRKALRAAMMQKQADLIMKAANNQAVNETINAAATQEVESTLSELFGRKVTKGYVMNEAPAHRSILKSFFGWLSSRASQVLSDITDTSSQPKG